MKAKFIPYITLLFTLQCFEDYPPANVQRDIDLQGHRGARGDRPENTWAGFKFALENGIRTLELDTVMTVDEVLVVHHDTKLNAQICQYGDSRKVTPKPILALEYKEIAELDCGIPLLSRFPDQQPAEDTQLLTLPQFFEKVKQWQKDNNGEEVQFNIEIKFSYEPVPEENRVVANAKAFLRDVKNAGVLSTTYLQSFHHPVLKAAHQIEPKLRLVTLIKPDRFDIVLVKFGINDQIYDKIIERSIEFNAGTISPYYLYVSREFVLKANDKGLAVIPWTVNEEEDIFSMYEAGVQGVISDYPLRMQSALKKYRGTTNE